MAEDELVKENMSAFFSEYVPPGYTGVRKFHPIRWHSLGGTIPPSRERTLVEIPKSPSAQRAKWLETYNIAKSKSQELIRDENYRVPGYGGHIPRSTNSFGNSYR